MDRLPEHRILKFHPDTLTFVRKEYGLDKPGQMDAAIDLLEDWVSKQSHFTMRDFPRTYLERTIILDKGSVEKAKVQMDKLFTMKTILPNFFGKFDAKHDFGNLSEYYTHAIMPKLTREHYRIYAGKLLRDGFTTELFTHFYGLFCLIIESIRAHDYCMGFVGIVDYRDTNIIDLVTQINVMELNHMFKFLTDGYQMRVKGLHLLTASKAINVLVRVFKQVLSEKLGNRIYVHNSLESLYEVIPKNVLPEDFGGEQKSLVKLNNEWVEELSLKENIEYFKEMSKARVNENLRNGSTTSKEDLLGLPGTFRTLSVD